MPEPQVSHLAGVPGGTQMPNSEPWSMGELVRTVTNFAKTLDRIEEKLDSRPDWDDINRLETSRNKEQVAQDVAIKAVEDRLARVTTTAVGAVLAALTAMGGWIVSLLNG